MTPGEASCPGCDAPASADTALCPRCGYRLLDDSSPRPPSRRPLLVLGALAVGAIATAAALALSPSGGEGAPRPVAMEAPRLEVLADHPLSTRAAERRLEARFTAPRDDETAAVRCSKRVAKPAHAVRRCLIRYPNGMERFVVLIMTARGDEVIGRR